MVDCVMLRKGSGIWLSWEESMHGRKWHEPVSLSPSHTHTHTHTLACTHMRPLRDRVQETAQLAGERVVQQRGR